MMEKRLVKLSSLVRTKEEEIAALRERLEVGSLSEVCFHGHLFEIKAGNVVRGIVPANQGLSARAPRIPLLSLRISGAISIFQPKERCFSQGPSRS